MPWIVPVKRSTLSKSTRFSKYATVEESEYFLLQKRKLLPQIQAPSSNIPSSSSSVPPPVAPQSSQSVPLQPLPASSAVPRLSVTADDANPNFPLGPEESFAPVKNVRPAWRIVTKGTFPYYEVAYGFPDPNSSGNENLLAREWRYITQELPNLIPPYLAPKDRTKWFLAHFTQLAIENTNPLAGKKPAEAKTRRWPFRSKRKSANGPGDQLQSSAGAGSGAMKPASSSDPEANSGEELKGFKGTDSPPLGSAAALSSSAPPTARGPNSPASLNVPTVASASNPLNMSDPEDFLDAEDDSNELTDDYEKDEKDAKEDEQEIEEELEQNEQLEELESENEAEYYSQQQSLDPQQNAAAMALYQSSIAAASAAKSARIASSAALELQRQRDQELRLKWRADQFNQEAQRLNLKEGFIFGEPESLRGMPVFAVVAVLLNFLFLLIRDASLNSFLLFTLLVNLSLFYLIVKGKPVTIAVHFQQTQQEIEHFARYQPNANPNYAAPQNVAVNAPNVPNSPQHYPAVSSPAPLSRASSAAGNSSPAPAPAAAVPQSPLSPGAPVADSAPLSPASHLSSAPVHSSHSLSPAPAAASQAPSAAAISSSGPAAGTGPGEFIVSGSNSSMHLPAVFRQFTSKIAPFSTMTRFDDLSPNANPPPSSWGYCPGTAFSCRVGPNYRKNKQKAQSGPSMYECVGIDTWVCDQKVDNIGQLLQLPIPVDPATGQYTDNYWTEYGAPELIIIQFQLPSYDPGYGFNKKDDGEGFAVVIYYKMTEQTKKELKNNSTAAACLLKKFLAELPTGGDENHGRFKSIPKVANPESPVLGRAMKSLLKSYNAKPFLTGPFAHGFIRTRGYLEVDIDVHRFCFMARKAAFGFLDSLKGLMIDIAFVVEGTSDEELPEQILGATRINFFDPKSAKHLNQVLQEAQKK